MAGGTDAPQGKTYNPHGDTFTGSIMENMGYLSREQHGAADFYDSLAGTLAKNNKDFKKPFYGHIANGENQSILAEYQRQTKPGSNGEPPLISAEQAQKLDQQLKGFEGVPLGLKGEQPGSDIERADGPLKKVLAVQKELRDMEKAGTLVADSPEAMAKLTKETADRIGIKDYPAKLEQRSDATDHKGDALTFGPIEPTGKKTARADDQRGVDHLLTASAGETAERHSKPQERRLS